MISGDDIRDMSADEIEQLFLDQLPEWASSRVGVRSPYKQHKASLPTRDGRVSGNAVVVRQIVKSHGVYTRIVTDAGNVMDLTDNEIESMFHPPEFIMEFFLSTHRTALIEKGEGYVF